jgi:hypothetical protein
MNCNFNVVRSSFDYRYVLMTNPDHSPVEMRKSPMSVIAKYRRFRQALHNADPTAFVGIIDLAYEHYALGDTLTTEIDLAVQAIEAGRQYFDLIVMADPSRPAASMQRFITPSNYLYYLDNLLPAYLCMPMLRSLRIIGDRPTLHFNLMSYAIGRQPMWPTLGRHFRRRNYPLGHARVNAFYEKHGHIPKFNAPLGYELWVKQFMAQQFADRIVVVINPRQGALSSTPTVPYRDAPLPEWYRFLRWSACEHPKVMYLAVGAFAEWENALHQFPNVFIPRTRGLHLGHELALLAHADMFLGTSSGFATFATFSDIPYVVLNIEEHFAGHAGIEAGDERYPFAREGQILTWEQEDAEALRHLFERILATIDVAAILAKRQSWAGVPDRVPENRMGSNGSAVVRAVWHPSTEASSTEHRGDRFMKGRPATGEADARPGKMGQMVTESPDAKETGEGSEMRMTAPPTPR